VNSVQKPSGAVLTQKSYDIAVIGAGAAGLMFASLVKNLSICVIDANPTIGAKIKVSGGGKCNVTNKYMNSTHFDGDEAFVGAVLKELQPSQLLQHLAEHGFKPSLQEKIVRGQYFFKSSSELLDHFTAQTKHVKFMMNTKVLSVTKESLFEISTDKGGIKAKCLVVASGGVSYPILNATPIGYEIAKTFGHDIVTTKPALVGFTVQKEQFWMKELSGISTPVFIKVADKQIIGDMLFAHKGCSGPAILSASLYWDKGTIEVDFLPGFEFDQNFKTNAKQLTSLLPLPKNLSKALLAQLGLTDKQAKSLTKNELETLQKLKSYSFAPAGTFGYSKAEVTKGGVNTARIDDKSMQSKLCDDIFFLGEVLDVTGELGGYNLHWAFASATVCAKHFVNVR